MPVEFLTETQKKEYGRFAGELSSVELTRYFHLDDPDRVLIDKRRGDHNRLGMALQIGTVRFLGTFLANPIDVPDEVKIFVSQQLNIKNTASLSRYMEREATRLEHTTTIRQHYGYLDFNDPPWRFRLSRWLYARAWLTSERPSLMFDFATNWLIRNKILLPGATTLTRLIAQIRNRASQRTWQRLSALPSETQKEMLLALFEVPEGKHTSRFDQLRQSPTRVSSPSLLSALDRYEELSALGVRPVLSPMPSSFGTQSIFKRYLIT